MKSAIPTKLMKPQWNWLAPLMPGGCRGKRGPRTENRRFMDAIFWMARSGRRWRDLAGAIWIAVPSSGTTIDWVERGVLQDLFDSLSDDGDFDGLCVYATVFRTRQHASAARRQKGGSDAEGLGPFQGRPEGQASYRDRQEKAIDE